MDQGQLNEITLEQFKIMFPNLAEGDIETILRSKNGNNDGVLDELLALSSKTRRSQPLSGVPSNFFFCDPPPPYSAVIDKDSCNQQQPAASASESLNSTSNASNEIIDDEKIALLIQNEEFLDYLKRNKNFMQELYGTEYMRQSPRYRNQLRLKDFYKNVSNQYNSLYNCNDFVPNMTVPRKPVFKPAQSSIPNGPIVDYNYNDNTIWSKRLKSKISGKSQNSYAGMPVEPISPHVELEPYNQVMFSNFPSRLRAMSKSSQEAFTSLARKFSSTKKTPMIDAANRTTDQ